MNTPISLVLGWLLDRIIGDPPTLPHPVVAFGKIITHQEQRLNKGKHRKAKGTIMAASLIILTFILTHYLIHLSPFENTIWGIILTAILVFYSLAGTTLVREVKAVFQAVNQSVEAGRQQVARIVGRDTSQLTTQQIRTAALETLAENLSDGVVAPLFWYAILGIPGMLTYKMINTLDSMIAYRTPRYQQFGAFAAHIDDIANYIPARLTALTMIVSSQLVRITRTQTPKHQNNSTLAKQLIFLRNNARKHISPNSGFPEAAMAAILDCRFGGGHTYFGKYIQKPYIGTNEREINDNDLKHAVNIALLTEIIALLATLSCTLLT